MSEVVWSVKKYGQVTEVYVDGKKAYVSGNTVKAEAKNLRALIETATIENTVVIEQ